LRCKQKPLDQNAPQITRLQAEIVVVMEQIERVKYLQQCMQLNAGAVGTLAIMRKLPGSHCSKSWCKRKVVRDQDFVRLVPAEHDATFAACCAR